MVEQSARAAESAGERPPRRSPRLQRVPAPGGGSACITYTYTHMHRIAKVCHCHCRGIRLLQRRTRTPFQVYIPVLSGGSKAGQNYTDEDLDEGADGYEAGAAGVLGAIVAMRSWLFVVRPTPNDTQIGKTGVSRQSFTIEQ